MNRLLPTPFIFTLLLAVLSLFSCKKDDIDNSDNDGYPIELTISKPGRNIELSWTRTNVSNFEQYVVVRSLDSILNTPSPSGEIIAIIDNVDDHQFVDVAFPLSERVFYKVYAKTGDRFLFSQSKSIDFDVNLLEIAATSVIHFPSNKSLYLYDDSKDKLFRYDYEKDTLAASKNLTLVSNLKMAVANNGFGDEIYYCLDNSNNVVVADAGTLETKTTFQVNDGVSNLEAGTGFIYAATFHWSNPLAIYKRSSLDFVNGETNVSNFERLLKIVPGTMTDLVVADFNIVSYYRFDENGQTLSAKSLSTFSNLLSSIVFSPDNQHFLWGTNGLVMDKNLSLVATVPNPDFNQFTAFVFSKEGNKLYGFSNSFASQVHEFTYPDLALVKTMPLSYNVTGAFNGEGNELLLVGLVFLPFETKTIIDEIEF